MLVRKETAVQRFSTDWIVATALRATVVFVRVRRRQMLYSYCNKIFCKWNKNKRTRKRSLFLTENTDHLVKPRTYRTIISSSTRSAFIFLLSETLQPKSGPGRLIVEVSRTHTDTPHLVGLLWTRDQSVVENSTSKNTTFTRDRHQCSERDSNPQCQQACGRRPTPLAARHLGSAPSRLDGLKSSLHCNSDRSKRNKTTGNISCFGIVIRNSDEFANGL